MNFPLSPEIIRALFSVSLTILIAIIVDNLFRLFMKLPKHFNNRRARTYVTILRNIATVVIYTIALNIIFIILGINITPLLASAGIIGITIGIGARPLVEDLITGLFLLSQDSIAVDDYVRIDDVEGTIEAMGMRTLRVRDDTGAIAIIPNGQVKKVINFSRNKASVLIDIPVKSDQGIETALKAAGNALTLLQKEEDLKSSLFPGAAVNGIEEIKPDGGVLIRSTILTYPARRFDVARRYRYLVIKEFEKQKILLG